MGGGHLSILRIASSLEAQRLRKCCMPPPPTCRRVWLPPPRLTLCDEAADRCAYMTMRTTSSPCFAVGRRAVGWTFAALRYARLASAWLDE